ncbi:MAG: hypothetical protein BJ554DRAFT_4107, partial [Olpidium bornovanus]
MFERFDSRVRRPLRGVFGPPAEQLPPQHALRDPHEEPLRPRADFLRRPDLPGRFPRASLGRVRRAFFQSGGPLLAEQAPGGPSPPAEPAPPGRALFRRRPCAPAAGRLRPVQGPREAVRRSQPRCRRRSLRGSRENGRAQRRGKEQSGVGGQAVGNGRAQEGGRTSPAFDTPAAEQCAAAPAARRMKKSGYRKPFPPHIFSPAPWRSLLFS